jgi:hypothetical protein
MTNTGATTINGWSLAFTLPSGQAITSGWNVTYSPTSGTVTAKNLTYNAVMAANASATIGFQAAHTGNTASPRRSPSTARPAPPPDQGGTRPLPATTT